MSAAVDGICAHAFDSTVCVAPAGHDGAHVTSNERFPHGLQLPSSTGTPLFVAIAEFCLARGLKGLSKIAGCCEVQVDDCWFFAVNGHAEPTMCAKTGQPIPPFSAYVEFNGWPAGLLDPTGGVICAGELANEQTFRAALQQVRARPAPHTGHRKGPRR